MDTQDASQEIINNLKEWSKEQDRLVVAIDGVSGVGKSTIMDLMSGKYSDALFVHMDDFLTPIEYRQSLVDKGCKPEELVEGLFDYADIRNLIEEYKKGNLKSVKTLAYKSGKRQIERIYDLTKRMLVIEGTYMVDPKYFNDLWDKRIYLDGNEEEIKKRRVARTKQMMGENFIPEDDPRSFFNIGLKTFKEYQKQHKPKEKADLVLNIAI